MTFTREQVAQARANLKRLAQNAGPKSNAAILVWYIQELEEDRDGPD